MPDRDRMDPPSQSQQQAAPTAATGSATTPQPISGPTPQGLPTEAEPVSPNYVDMGCFWWGSESEHDLSNGQTLDCPGDVFFAPPVHGRGIIRNQIIFAFDLLSGEVTACIGVRNPCEYNRPMFPYVGVSYPNPTMALRAGQRVHLHRVDIIDLSKLPPDIRSWEMTPGAGGGSGRGRWPSLAPYMTAVNGNARVGNIQVESFAVTI